MTDVEEVIDMAKRKLEKEREMFMSKSLPGFPGDNQSSNDNENESDSDEDSDESDEKGEKLFFLSKKLISLQNHDIFIPLLPLQFVKKI